MVATFTEQLERISQVFHWGFCFAYLQQDAISSPLSSGRHDCRLMLPYDATSDGFWIQLLPLPILLADAII